MRIPRMQLSREQVVRRQLLRWYDRHRRDLPWRKTRDPYRIWVSEIMLQQTRVQAVIPFYENFLLRFPDVHALAAAQEDDLLACWSGLGYYSRARNLQRAARLIIERHNGCFPHELKDALALPGIGRYSAAAVLSIAYDTPLPVVDGNVARVLARLFALKADVRTSSGKALLLKHAKLLLSPRRPGDFNQALMELGATICVPQQPLCGACPIRKNCRAFCKSQVEKYPPPRRSAQPVLRRFTAALVLNSDGKCLLARRAASERWMKGFWELPMQEKPFDGLSHQAPRFMAQHGIRLGALLGHVRHTITTNKLDVAVFRATLSRAANPPAERWVPLPEISRLPVTTVTRKALRLAALDCRKVAV